MSGPVVEDVSLDELKRGLASGSIALVDVREQNEWDAGHIADATLNALSTFDPQALAKRQPGRRVVLHCRSGKRSVIALRSRASRQAVMTCAPILGAACSAGRVPANPCHRPEARRFDHSFRGETNMNHRLVLIAAFAALTSATPSRADPIEDRQGYMKRLGDAFADMGKMNKGDLPYDQAKVDLALDRAIDAAENAPKLFPEDVQDGTRHRRTAQNLDR